MKNEKNTKGTSDRFKGYENRETWTFQFRITEDIYTYARLRDMARDSYAEAVATEKKHIPTDELACVFLSEKLDEYHEYLIRHVAHESKDILDMLHEIGSPWRINYREVAEMVFDSHGATIKETFHG